MPDREDFAAALAAQPLTNLHRIGGEMFAWSDTGRDLPGGALLRLLLTELTDPGRTVLVAGPHADEVVAGLSGAGAAVTWLVRSLTDAEQAAQEHPGVTVLAGSIGKLDPAARFDVVVAGGGVDRLNSAEGEQLAAAELIDRLAAAVGPGGALLLAHDNHFGLHHTVRLEPGARQRRDDAWYPPDPRRPASPAQLGDRLTGTGLTVDATYAAFPEPFAPTVLVGDGLTGDVASPLRPRLGAALSQAYAAAFRGRAVLNDPRRLIDRALRAGAESTVAAGWLVVARAGSVSTRRHELLIGDRRGTFAYEVSPAGTSLLQPLGQPVERAGLRRIAEPPDLGAVSGYLLEERLLELCGRAETRQLRVELARYDAWLRESSGPALPAGFADVLVTADGPVLLPTRWAPVEPVPVEIALVRAMWQFAVQLITSGQPHPWPLTSGAADLTAILLGMVDRTVTGPQLRAAVDLQVAWETAEFELSLTERHDRRLQLLAVRPGSAQVDVPGYQELAEALWRQRYEASHLLAMLEWNEQIIRSRDNTLSRMDWELQFYRKSLAGRAMQVTKRGLRTVRKRLR
ncbi:hypothetical protein ACWKSP_31890 [Micromonosporaceae bacterium Da 78-11]